MTPPVDTKIETPCRLAILGRRKVIEEVAGWYGLEVLGEIRSRRSEIAVVMVTGEGDESLAALPVVDNR